MFLIVASGRLDKGRKLIEKSEMIVALFGAFFRRRFMRCLSDFRCENYTISLLEQCENLEEVETLLQTKTSGHQTHKDANYFMAILGANFNLQRSLPDAALDFLYEADSEPKYSSDPN